MVREGSRVQIPKAAPEVLKIIQAIYLFFNRFFMDGTNLENCYNRYLQYRAVIKNFSPTTITNYKTTLKVFLRDTKIQSLDEINRDVLEQWFFHGRLKRKWSSATFKHYFKHINCFLKWLIKEGKLEVNYLDSIEKPRLETRLPRTLTGAESKLVLDASFHMRYRYKLEKYRNRAVVATMLFAGLRRYEVVNLKRNDVSIENKMIFVNQGKGKKDRMVSINARLLQIYKEYLKERDRVDKDSIHFFLSIGKKEAFGFKGIKKLMHRLREVTKLNFSAHTLRHSFATLMLEGGCDIYTLSKIMGHSKITTTTIYLSCSKGQMSKSVEMHVLN